MMKLINVGAKLVYMVWSFLLRTETSRCTPCRWLGPSFPLLQEKAYVLENKNRKEVVF